MGQEKRPPTSHRKTDKPPQQPPLKMARVSPSNVVLPSPTEINLECERALNALRRGNHHEALRLMMDASPKFERSAIFHCISGTISAKAAAIIDDSTAKQRHFKNAIESAKKARSIFPNSID